LEQQYQRQVRMEVCRVEKWNNFLGFFEETRFVHNLEQMTQLNKRTKVQRPLRRSLLSVPLPRANGTAEPAEQPE